MNQAVALVGLIGFIALILSGACAAKLLLVYFRNEKTYTPKQKAAAILFPFLILINPKSLDGPEQTVLLATAKQFWLFFTTGVIMIVGSQVIGTGL